MPRVLITGAAGFIGMHTSIRFLREGWDVVGLDNLNDYYSVSLKRDRLNEISKVASKLGCAFELLEADLNSEIWKELESIHFDAFVHLAAQAGVRYSIENPRAYLESNILGFQSVIEFVSKTGINRFLYASSSSVYGKNAKQPFNEHEPCDSPESYYAATKIANELMAKSYFKTERISSIGLRFFTVYGPWGRPDMAPYLFTQAAFENKPINIFNNGNQDRDFTYIDDVVQGIYRLCVSNRLPEGSHLYNIGRGEPVKLLDFVTEIEKQTNKILQKKYLPAQKGDVSSTYADTSMLQRTIEYHPCVSLSKGVENFVSWYIEYYNIIIK